MSERRIMLVDDDASLLDSLERVLFCDDYEIIKCDSPVVACNLIDDYEGNIDIVISDNKMPQVKGTDFFISLRNDYPDIIRIMLTGQSDLTDAQSAINEGEVYRFLLKPVDPFEIELIVKRALSHKDLWLQNKNLKNMVRSQKSMLSSLEKEHPGITKVNRDANGIVVINEPDFDDSFDDYINNLYRAAFPE